MKTLTRLFLCAMLILAGTAARAERIFNQAELDALLAPVALYPDAVLNDILEAANYPDDVREAAAWTRANPQLRGDDAVRLAEGLPWHPSVKALVAMPEVLDRMDESPQWLADLAEAHRVHGPYVMETVQSLRARAQANGYRPEPVSPNVVYVRYYDPYVVYGPWWWPAYRPIVWRPFVTRVVVVNRPHAHYVHRPVVVHKPIVQHRHVVEHKPRRVVEHKPRPVAEHKPPVVRGPVVVQKPPVDRAQHRSEPRRDNGRPSPAAQIQREYTRERQQQRAPQQGWNRGNENRQNRGGHRG